VPLERYRAKRDFSRTPEPAGPEHGSPLPAAPGGCGRFVVHRHRASRLHYDLRLEVGGALASWAVPRGPTLDPAQRRFAVRTEDHPIEYLDFEGVIPPGQYGAGDSICWDWGTFEPEGTWDPAAALAAGELKLRLRGEKLVGRFTLVRTGDGGRPGPGAGGRRGEEDGDGEEDGNGEGSAWLLIAKPGPGAVAGWDAEDHPASVKSGLTSDELAAGVLPRFAHPAPAPLPTLDPEGSRAAARPAFVEPMLATPATAPFDDPDWLFEPKWDGYRVEAIVADGKVTLRTRNRHDAGEYFPELLAAPTWLAAPAAVVDGEVVALDEKGHPDFGLLQARLGGGPGTARANRAGAEPAGPAASVVLVAFDLPWCAGRSYLGVPLETRKEILRLVLREHPRVRYGSHVRGEGIAFYTAVAAQGLEGAMAKHRLGRYEAGRRSTAWLKLKVRPTQELVVGGYVAGRGSHHDLGALVVGVMDGGRLRYAGRVGSGIDGPTRARLRAALDARSRSTPPFDIAPPDLERTPGAAWADPTLVIRAEMAGWTRDGLVRQAAFAGEAPEVNPASVERQEAVGPEAAARALARAGRRTGSAATQPVRSPAAQPITPPSAGELAALEALPGSGGPWHVGGREVRLTNLDRVLAPGRSGAGPEEARPVTKRDLVRYYALVAPALLPHLAGRALNLARYPGGIDAPSFWQKEVGRGTPAWLARWREPDPPDRRPHDYLLADGVATLAWLGNQAAVEIHPWTSRIEAPAEPRWALVDIDPGPRTTWEETLVLARLFRRALDHLGVPGFPKVSGKRGIQVFVPLRAGYSYEETRAWVEQLSRAVGGAVPDLVSWEWSKDRRDGRARLDFTQNWRNRTLVAPYSPRAAAGLPVSAPISWDELDDPDLRPDRWTIRTIPARVAARGDLFAGALGPGRELPPL